MIKSNFKNFKLSKFKITNLFCADSTCSWVALIVFFSVLNVVVLGASIFLYFKIDKGQIFVSELDKREVSNFNRLRKSELSKVINSFESRKEEFSRLKNENFTSIIDPSL